MQKARNVKDQNILGVTRETSSQGDSFESSFIRMTPHTNLLFPMCKAFYSFSHLFFIPLFLPFRGVLRGFTPLSGILTLLDPSGPSWTPRNAWNGVSPVFGRTVAGFDRAVTLFYPILDFIPLFSSIGFIHLFFDFT